MSDIKHQQTLTFIPFLMKITTLIIVFYIWVYLVRPRTKLCEVGPSTSSFPREGLM